jgi:ribosomal protein S18 acetylase RimI-like enzyme
MEAWMRANGVEEVWVCADNEAAVEFYRGCGFSAGIEQPVYMTREM